MYRGGQLRDTSEVSEVGVKTIQQFRLLGPFIHPLNSSLSVDHGAIHTPFQKFVGNKGYHSNFESKR